MTKIHPVLPGSYPRAALQAAATPLEWRPPDAKYNHGAKHLDARMLEISDISSGAGLLREGAEPQVSDMPYGLQLLTMTSKDVKEVVDIKETVEAVDRAVNASVNAAVEEASKSNKVDSEWMYVDPKRHDTVDRPTHDKRSKDFGNWTFVRGDEFIYYKTHARPKPGTGGF